MTEPYRASAAVGHDALAWNVSMFARRAPWIVLGLAVGILLGMVYNSTKSPSYAAVAQVNVRTTVQDPFGGTQDITKIVSMETERRIAQSSQVAARAASIIGGEPSTTYLDNHLSVVNPPNTLILTFTFSVPSRRAAIAGANAFARSFLEYRQQNTQASVRTISKTLTSQVAILQKRLSLVETKLKTAKGQDRTILSTEQTNYSAQISSEQLQVNSLNALDTSPGNQIQVASTASLGGIGRKTVLAVFVILGLVGGLVLARLRERLDTRVATAGEAARTLRAPLLNERPLERASRFRKPAERSSRRRHSGPQLSSSFIGCHLLVSPSVTGTSLHRRTGEKGGLSLRPISRLH